MADDVLLNKAAVIERGVPQSARHVFALLAQGSYIDATPGSFEPCV
jgi:hypothetical protein